MESLCWQRRGRGAARQRKFISNFVPLPTSHHEGYSGTSTTKQKQNMKNKTTESTRALASTRKALRFLLTTSVATMACLPVFATDYFREYDRHKEETHYKQINLVSDIAGAAQIQDTNLVNGWGIAFGPNGPIWISANGSGNATIYAVTNDASGAAHVTRNPLVVAIPGNGGATGNVFNNNTNAFNADVFIFASTDGTISGWRPPLGNAAEVLARREGAIYTGIALVTNNANPVLLVANFSEGTIDMYSASLQLIGQFADRHAPSRYAPYNVQNVTGTVFVTFAKQNESKNVLLFGRRRGLIDTFNPATGKFRRFAAGKAAGGPVREMNAPWGIALAPASFGSHADQLLVGNFGSGTIMTFDEHGRFRGLLKGSEECAVTIDGLWGLAFGRAGTAGVPTDLYFTAGPGGETHGLFGVIQTSEEADDNDRDDDDDRN